MNIGIFYFSLVGGPNRQLIHLPNGVSGYIRVQEIQGDNLERALAKASPRKGEVIMNTHWLETWEE